MKLREIREKVYNHVLTLRAIERLMQSGIFEQAWNDSNEDKQLEVASWIAAFDVEAIKRWLRTETQVDCNIRELRRKASRLGIKDYALLTKAELLNSIYHKEKDGDRNIRDSSRNETHSSNVRIETGSDHLQEVSVSQTRREESNLSSEVVDPN